MNIIIFSVDLVFINIIKRIVEAIDKPITVKVYQFFSEAYDLSLKNSCDLLFVDNQIIGTSSYELISFLRLQKKQTCPLFYFGTSEYDGERKALLIGANVFFKKPFIPNEVSREINIILQKI